MGNLDYMKIAGSLVDFSYDKEADVLYITFGDKVDGIVKHEPQDGVLIRHCVKSGRLSGITIINLTKQIWLDK